MMRYLLALVLGSSIALAAPRSTITVPDGWTPEPVADAELKRLLTEGTLRVEANRWRAPDGAMLQVLELHIRHRAPTGNIVDDIEHEVGKEFVDGKELSKTRRTAGNQLVVDHVARAHDLLFHMRRVYAADASGILHVAIASCAGSAPVPACDAALDTLAVPVDAVPLERGSRTTAYEVGRIAGGFLLVLLVGAYFWSNRKKKPAG